MNSYKEKIKQKFNNTRNYCLLFPIFFTLLSGMAQEQRLSFDLGDLWKGKYEPERLEAIRSMNDGSHYTVLEQDQASNSSAIVSYAYANAGERKILFDSSQFPEFLKISGYTFSSQEEKN